jgi:hypothetical protein
MSLSFIASKSFTSSSFSFYNFSMFSSLFWLFTTSIILIGTMYLFSIKKYWVLPKKKIFFAFSILVVTMCLPRVAFYELYIIVPTIFYLSTKFYNSSNNSLSKLGFIFLLIMFGVHDINAVFFLMSLIIFVLFFINFKKSYIKLWFFKVYKKQYKNYKWH